MSGDALHARLCADVVAAGAPASELRRFRDDEGPCFRFIGPRGHVDVTVCDDLSVVVLVGVKGRPASAWETFGQARAKALADIRADVLRIADAPASAEGEVSDG